MKPKFPENNWLIVAEFPSYADAKAFQELVAPLGAISLVARVKHQYDTGSFPTWRMTKCLEQELSVNSFNKEMLHIAAQLHGFTALSATSWLGKAVSHGVIRRLERGVYEFIPREAIGAVASQPPATHALHDPLCASCTPLPFQLQTLEGAPCEAQ